MKNKKIRVVVSLVLAIATIMALGINASALRVDKEAKSVEDIISSYKTEIKELRADNSKSATMKQQAINLKRAERDTELSEAGYEVYNVNSESYESVEVALKTDLSELGLNSESSYLIVIDGKDKDESTDHGKMSATNNYQPLAITPLATYSAFNYTYNGVVYALRYMYVLADDEEADTSYFQASYVDLLRSNVSSIISNCLDTIISSYISAIYSPFGTVASIFGLSISDIGYAANSVMQLWVDSEWSRVYTQVWDNYDQMWTIGSSVEKVLVNSSIHMNYYSSITHNSEQLHEDLYNGYEESDNYNNYTWRKTQAIIQYLNGLPCTYDTTGSVYYYYGNSIAVVHYEPAYY